MRRPLIVGCVIGSCFIVGCYRASESRKVQRPTGRAKSDGCPEQPTLTPLSEFQRQTDAQVESYINDPHLSIEQHAEAVGFKAQFDALSRIDARFGTHEVKTSIHEELARSERILTAMEEARTHGEKGGPDDTGSSCNR